MIIDDEMYLTPEEAALLVSAMRDFPTPTCESGERVRWVALRERIEAHAALVPPPLNGDKVWYGVTARLVKNGTQQNQCRTIVRAKSKAEAKRFLEAAGDRQGLLFDTHWGVTNNRRELVLAKERGVWAEGSDGWVKVWPK